MNTGYSFTHPLFSNRHQLLTATQTCHTFIAPSSGSCSPLGQGCPSPILHPSELFAFFSIPFKLYLLGETFPFILWAPGRTGSPGLQWLILPRVQCSRNWLANFPTTRMSCSSIVSPTCSPHTEHQYLTIPFFKKRFY